MPPPTRAEGPSTGLWVLIGVLGAICAISLSVAIYLLVRAAPESRAATTASVTDAAAAVPALSAVSSAQLTADASPSSSATSASAKPGPALALALSDAELDELAGNYTCRMDDTPTFPCRVSGGTLEKLAGSQRFRGAANKLDNGNIAFNGTFFCPFGECTEPVSATFVRQGPGRYVGTLSSPRGERVVLVKVR